MPRLETLKVMNRILVLGVLATALTALVGFQATAVSAQGASRLWSIAVHIEYQNGTVYEQVFASGVPMSLMPSILEACGRSHWTGSVVRYHCFPIPE